MAELSKNGWFSASTLSAIKKADSAAAVAQLIGGSPGAASLAPGTNLDALAAQLLRSPAKASTVLMMSMGGATLDQQVGARAQDVRAALQEIVYAHRHLDNLETYVGYGFTSYTSLEQLQTDLTSARQSAVDGLWAKLAPLALADVRAAALAWQNASGAADRGLAEQQREAVLKDFTALVKERMPAPLWAELSAGGQGKAAGRLENLLQRGPHGPDFEKARDVVTLFMTNGAQGAGLHQLFYKALKLEMFTTGGYIPDKVGRGDELWK